MGWIWQLVILGAGVVALVLVFQLLSVPEWIETYLKHRKPRAEMEAQLADLQRRVSEIEARVKSPQ